MSRKKTPKDAEPKRRRHRYDSRRGIVIAPGIQAADLWQDCALTEDEREALGLGHMSHDGRL